MSNDPSTREVSSAAQGIKMAQIVAGISENWAVAFYKPVSQACCLWRKGKSFIQSLIFSTGLSLIAIILQLLLSTSLCSGPSCPPLSLQTLLQSRSASPHGHQQTECSPLGAGYNSLWVSSDALNKISIPNKHPHLNPYFQLLGALFHWNVEIFMQTSLVLKLMVPPLKTAAAILADTFFTNWNQDLTWEISPFKEYFYFTFWLPPLIEVFSLIS